LEVFAADLPATIYKQAAGTLVFFTAPPITT
jgi:hypothetical protein